MNNPEQKTCEVCGSPLMYIDHYEVDGITEFGSHEPYYECPNGCPEPTERRIDTCTEAGVIITQPDEHNQLSTII